MALLRLRATISILLSPCCIHSELYAIFVEICFFLLFGSKSAAIRKSYNENGSNIMRKEEISIEHLYTHIYDVDGIVNFCAAIKKNIERKKLCSKDSDSNSGGRHSTTS